MISGDSLISVVVCLFSDRCNTRVESAARLAFIVVLTAWRMRCEFVAQSEGIKIRSGRLSRILDTKCIRDVWSILFGSGVLYGCWEVSLYNVLAFVLGLNLCSRLY